MREKQQAFNELAVIYDQKWQEAAMWRKGASDLEKEDHVLREQLLQIVDQEQNHLCDSQFLKWQEATSMRRVALVLEVELYKLRDQVVQLGDEVGAEVEKLRGQVLEQEEQRKDLEEELEYSKGNRMPATSPTPPSSPPYKDTQLCLNSTQVRLAPGKLDSLTVQVCDSVPDCKDKSDEAPFCLKPTCNLACEPVLFPAPEIREFSRIRSFSGNSTENSTENSVLFQNWSKTPQKASK